MSSSRNHPSRCRVIMRANRPAHRPTGLELLESRVLLSTYSIWDAAATPGGTFTDTDRPEPSIEVGVRFRSDVPGTITAIRFYDASTNTAITQRVNLWTNDGVNLATAEAPGDAGVGWRDVALPAGVPIVAGQTYVASYFAPDKTYAADRFYAPGSPYFTYGVDRAPLHAVPNGDGGPNGAFIYGAASAFPVNGNGGNYWVDVLFVESSTPQVLATSPVDGAVVPAYVAESPGVGPVISASFSEPINPATLTFLIRDSGGDALATEPMVYDAAKRIATLVPTGPLVAGETYTASVSGATDPDGNPIPATNWSFTAGAPQSIFAGPGASASTDTGAVEVGVKFRSDEAGYIAGIRFYKASAANRGIHSGTLWSSTGQKLASAIFANETDSGWQQVTFDDPVAIAANTTYIASYHAPAGAYSATLDAFATAGVDNAPLHILAASVDGGNGLFKYTTSSAFPDGVSPRSANYWVDVVFLNVSAPPPPTNATPTLAPIGDQAINELTPLSFTAVGNDSDPGQTLTYSLRPGTTAVPDGATIDPTTGLFNWTPAENQDGAWNITVRVTDNGSPTLFAEQPVNITVNEVNVAPVLGAIGNKTVQQGALLSFTATATDPDLPANTLSYSLINAPAGATIHPTTGAFTWTPPDFGSFVFTVRVSDNATPSLSDQEQITVEVEPLAPPGSAPVLGAIGDQSTQWGSLLSFTATATDPDTPAAGLVFSLVGAPAGASINPATGLFQWTPTAAQGPGLYTFAVEVSDGTSTDLEMIDVTVNKRPTNVVYTGALTGVYSDMLAVSAMLTDAGSGPLAGTPLAGMTVGFTMGAQSTWATTSAAGLASSNLKVDVGGSIQTTFAGDGLYSLCTDSDAFTMLKESANASYTGDALLMFTPAPWVKGAPARLAAKLTEVADGHAGDMSMATVRFEVYKSGAKTPYRVYTAPANAQGDAVVTAWLDPGAWVIKATIASDNACWTSNTASGAFAIAIGLIPQRLTGGGWINDPASADGKGEFGFNANYNKNGMPKGGSVYSFTGLDQSVYLVRSTSWQGGGMAFYSAPGKATFSSKVSVSRVDPSTGEAVTLFSNGWQIVDVFDGESAGQKDRYAITILNDGGAIWRQVGGPALGSQIVLGGGNIKVHAGNAIDDAGNTGELQSIIAQLIDCFPFSIRQRIADALLG